MKDPKRNFNIDYSRILAEKLRQVPAWKDLAQSCNEVFNKEIDERRRKLEKIRDSVKYRRGDTLVEVAYEPVAGKEAMFMDTREPANIPEGYVIKTARVINVIKNIAYFQHPENKDFLELEFSYKDRTTRWLKEFDMPQERDALLKNARIMGFDFFNTKLNDEDLQRLYEFVQLYWDESGSDDNFMKFIGFIKNARFDLVPLWSYEEDGAKTYEELRENPEKDVYPVLTQKPRDALTVSEGGSWYLTSHVEIRYDISQFDKFYTLNLDDLETLFYYFSPIILVLERIIGSLDIEVEHAILSVTDLTIDNYSTGDLDLSTPVNKQYHLEAASLSVFQHSQTNIDTDFVLPHSPFSATDVVITNSDKYELLNPENESFISSLRIAFPNYITVHNHSVYDITNPIALPRRRKPLSHDNVIDNYSVLNIATL